jgi:hypothetical protein
MATTDLAKTQLTSLARVRESLDGAGIAYWLFGGWAVDFYVGVVTRAHDDVDIAIWLTDLSRIDQLLRDDGWVHAPFEDEDGGTGYEREGVRLELTYLVPGDDGSVNVPLRRGLVPWTGDPLGDDVRALHEVHARLVSRASLVLAKSQPREDPHEAAKDRADFEQLARGG